MSFPNELAMDERLFVSLRILVSSERADIFPFGRLVNFGAGRPNGFPTLNVGRQPPIAFFPLIFLYIHSLLSFLYINQNAIIESRVCVLIRDQPESNTCFSV